MFVLVGMRACAFVWVFVLVLVLVSGNWSSDQRMCESFLLPPVSFPFRSLSFSVCPAVVLSSALPFALPPFLPLRFPFLFSPVVELWDRHCLRPCLVSVIVFSVLFPVCVRFRSYKTVVTLLLFSSLPLRFRRAKHQNNRHLTCLKAMAQRIPMLMWMMVI